SLVSPAPGFASRFCPAAAPVHEKENTGRRCAARHTKSACWRSAPPPARQTFAPPALALHDRTARRQVRCGRITADRHRRTLGLGSRSLDARQTRSALIVLWFTVFLDLLGFGIVIPLLPLYAAQLHASYLEVG